MKIVKPLKQYSNIFINYSSSLSMNDDVGIEENFHLQPLCKYQNVFASTSVANDRSQRPLLSSQLERFVG
jgi:hypothetical protein